MKTCASCHIVFNPFLYRIGKEGFGLNKPDFYCFSCEGSDDKDNVRVDFCTYECYKDHLADKHNSTNLI